MIVFGFSSFGQEVPLDPSGQTGYFLLTSSRSPESALPNKRLKLAGAYRLNGSRVLWPWRATAFGRHPCAGEWVARNLSAIR